MQWQAPCRIGSCRRMPQDVRKIGTRQIWRRENSEIAHATIKQGNRREADKQSEGSRGLAQLQRTVNSGPRIHWEIAFSPKRWPACPLLEGKYLIFSVRKWYFLLRERMTLSSLNGGLKTGLSPALNCSLRIRALKNSSVWWKTRVRWLEILMPLTSVNWWFLTSWSWLRFEFSQMEMDLTLPKSNFMVKGKRSHPASETTVNGRRYKSEMESRSLASLGPTTSTEGSRSRCFL